MQDTIAVDPFMPKPQANQHHSSSAVKRQRMELLLDEAMPPSSHYAAHGASRTPSAEEAKQPCGPAAPSSLIAWDSSLFSEE